MLLFALKRRRIYLSESLQQFNNTAALMLDRMEPPSASFCVSQLSSADDMKLSIAGDVIGMLVTDFKADLKQLPIPCVLNVYSKGRS